MTARRPFVVIAWISADWWGSTAYDETVIAASGADAMQQLEERLVADGARVRSITCHEEIA